MPGLIERLIERPQGFDLFQALHLLERAEPARKPVGGSLGLDEAVRLSGHVGLEFPPSDIHALGASRQPGPALTLSSAAMTLAGAQGPLPLVFTELLLQAQRARHPAGLALLDIFQQRLLAFLYRARRKHRVALAPEPVEAAPVLRVLDALSGLGRGEGARAPGGQPAWLRHAGLQGAAPRSMASLLALLRDRLGVRVQGRDFVGRWHALTPETQARLAARSANAAPAGRGLGTGAALGTRAWSPIAGIELSTPALPLAQFEALLPGGPMHGLLAWLVARHQQRDTQVQLRVPVRGAPTSRLGVRDQAGAGGLTRLGLSAWLAARPGTGTQECGLARLQAPRFLVRAQGTVHGH